MWILRGRCIECRLTLHYQLVNWHVAVASIQQYQVIDYNLSIFMVFRKEADLLFFSLRLHGSYFQHLTMLWTKHVENWLDNVSRESTTLKDNFFFSGLCFVWTLIFGHKLCHVILIINWANVICRPGVIFIMDTSEVAHMCPELFIANHRYMPNYIY